MLFRWDPAKAASNLKKHGVSFWMYLDEMDQSVIELTQMNGSKSKVSLTCESHD